MELLNAAHDVRELVATNLTLQTICRLRYRKPLEAIPGEYQVPPCDADAHHEAMVRYMTVGGLTPAKLEVSGDSSPSSSHRELSTAQHTTDASARGVLALGFEATRLGSREANMCVRASSKLHLNVDESKRKGVQLAGLFHPSQCLEAQLETLASAEGAETLMDKIYERLDELDPATAEVRASKILFGLGFTDDIQGRVTSSFSGGWRMRISLAQALFQGPTLLLLDEPTNHLDIEAVVWLESYLAKFDKILLMVSHSQDFMNGVCTDIIHMHQKKLIYYDGNYDQYVATRENLETNQMKRFENEQKQIDHMKDYIRRFEHSNEKRSRQAQSKMKVLEKMERGGLVEEVESDISINFHFESGGALPPPIIQFTDVGFNYPNRPLLYRGLNLGVTTESRICLVGPNGAGKTTLTKMMIRELDATEGSVTMSPYCKIARFHQHFVDLIDMELSPLAWFFSEFPAIKEPTPLRTALARFGVSGALQSVKMNTLSDGQKSRVVLAWMSFRSPHLMILDEPTNHLDIESIDALAEGINHFEGAVVVVSHDLRLIAQIAKEIWICEAGKVQRFNGDITDYKKHVQREVQRMESDHNKSSAAKTSASAPKPKAAVKK